MPLDVEHAEVVMDALPEASVAPPAARSGSPMSLADREALKERLRPLVLEIVDEALERHRRSEGY